jgi:hypothetical protein
MALGQPSPGNPLSDEDLQNLAALLARYATHELDQFEHWRVETPYGPVFIELAREVRSGATPSAYTTIWPRS